jgi:hypothetical protein
VTSPYFGSTIANALVWAAMCLIRIKLWDIRENIKDHRKGVN